MTKPEKANKKTYIRDLALLISVPMAVALIAVASVNLPKLMAKPKYDFVYSYCSVYRCKNGFSIDSSGHISEENYETSASVNYYSQPSGLFYYDVKNDSSRSISLDQANELSLNNSSKSPDGYVLTRDDYSGGALFWYTYKNDLVLKNGAKKRKLQLDSTNFTENNIVFLGWVNK